MLVNSTRFGELDIEEKNIISFKNGLPGFPDERSFAIFPYQDGSPFYFLQSTQDSNLSFLVVDPFAFFPDYEFKLEDETVQELGLASDNTPQIVNIVTIPEKIEQMTANLLAPVILNQRDRIGMQIVLEKTPYLTKHLVFPNGLHADKGGK